MDVFVLNGVIDVSVPTWVSAMLEADVLNGTINVVGLVLASSTTTSRSVHGRIGAGNGLIDLGTTNGTITVRGR